MEGREGILKYRYDYDWMVCFQYKTCKNWVGKLFGHVILFRNVSAINSIRVEPAWCGMLLIPYSINVKNIAKSLSEEYNCYVYTSLNEDYERVNLMLGFSCVSIVKNLLGINAWWIWTPRQLERYINKA